MIKTLDSNLYKEDVLLCRNCLVELEETDIEIDKVDRCPKCSKDCYGSDRVEAKKCNITIEYYET